MDEFRQYLSKVRDRRIGDFPGFTVSRARIQEAGEYLGLEYPESYTEFLEILGSGYIGGHEMYDVSSMKMGEAGDPCGVSKTEFLRRYGLPRHLLICSSLDDGLFSAIDCRDVNHDRSFPVYEYFGDNQLSLVANDFSDYFRTIVDLEMKIIDDEEIASQ